MEDSDLMGIIKQTAKHSDRSEVSSENVPPALKAWATNKNIFWSKKMQKFVENYPDCFESSLELLRKDLKMGPKEGLFSKLGMKGIEH